MFYGDVMTTLYEKIDSRLNIEVVSVLLAHPPMLTDVLARCARLHEEASQVTITCNAPERDGALMYIVQVEYRSGGVDHDRRTAPHGRQRDGVPLVTPLQYECISDMRDGWSLSSDLILRPPYFLRSANKFVRRQTINSLLRRGLVEYDMRNGYWILTKDGKHGALIK